MPIIKSAKKALKQNARNKSRNDYFKSVYRDSRKAFEKAIKDKSLEAAQKAYFNEKDKDGKKIKGGLQSAIDTLVKKNLIHKNNGSRKKSGFVKAMKALS